MAPFSIPTPSIIPLRLPIFGGPKSIDTKTKIQILCDTYLEHEIFYTLDGTKPQPYAGIVQGNKTIKYTSPFCLPSGKITIKAIAISAVVHTMCSSIVTKCFDVLKVQSSDDETSSTKKSKNAKSKNSLIKCENKQTPKDTASEKETQIPCVSDERLESDTNPENETLANCLEEAFIGSTDFELDSNEDDSEDIKSLPVKNRLDINDNHELPETNQFGIEYGNNRNDSLSQAMEKLTLETSKNLNKKNTDLTDSGTSVGSQFCCLKCDLTLQQCSSCNKVNSMSSKFCIGCGTQLLQICHFCKEWNSVIATYCQFCGKKLGCRMEPYIRLDQVNQSVMVKPESKNASIQVMPLKSEKCTQTTIHEKNSGKRSSSGSRRMPHVSPGGGYWHQQLDYICNHLKSHAYNNVEFRKEISEPSLCDFKSAHILREENNIIVSLSFTPYLPDKSAAPVSEKKKLADDYPESS